MLALCQHNILAYYAFYYAGIFDTGLVPSKQISMVKYTPRPRADPDFWTGGVKF